MLRFAMEKLHIWKEKANRKPLIIMGARQVGKTWLMKEFGRTCYEKVAYISFYNNKRMSDVFQIDIPGLYPLNFREFVCAMVEKGLSGGSANAK